MSLHLNQQNYGRSNGGGGNRNAQVAETLSLIRSIGVFLFIAILLRASVVEAFKIPSSSMESTLEIGDHILVNKLSYGLRLDLIPSFFPVPKFLQETFFEFRYPKRGDVVVFTLPDNPATPEDESETNIIKRVIGLPGDVVEVRGTRLFINGEQYAKDSDYAKWKQGGRKDFNPEKVPPGYVFLLGDNRDQSKDSRFWDYPFLEISRIKGRAFVIYWNSGFHLDRMFGVIH